MKASPLSPGSGGATLTGMRPRPWPPAMMFGNIKVMKSTGDRANAYTVALNELRKAETGLREWTAAAGELFRGVVFTEIRSSGQFRISWFWA